MKWQDERSAEADCRASEMRARLQAEQRVLDDAKIGTLDDDGFVIALYSDGGRTQIAHKDGVEWDQVPAPHPWHRCWVQTVGWINYFTRVQRCPCGGMTYERSGWMERNTRSDSPPWWRFW